jgi:hypothetical protein
MSGVSLEHSFIATDWLSFVYLYCRANSYQDKMVNGIEGSSAKKGDSSSDQFSSRPIFDGRTLWLNDFLQCYSENVAMPWYDFDFILICKQVPPIPKFCSVASHPFLLNFSIGLEQKFQDMFVHMC